MATKLKTGEEVSHALDVETLILTHDPSFRSDLQLAQLLAELNSMPDFFPVRPPNSASVSGTPYNLCLSPY